MGRQCGNNCATRLRLCGVCATQVQTRLQDLVRRRCEFREKETKQTSKRKVTSVRQRYVLGHQVAAVLLDWNRPVGRHFRAARPSSHPHILGSCVRIFGLVAHHHPVENACAYLYCNFVLERLSVLQITAGSWRSLAFSCCTLASLCV